MRNEPWVWPKVGGCRDERRGSSASEVGTDDGTAKKEKKKRKKKEKKKRQFIIIIVIIIIINALNAHMIHINLNKIFYTHLEHSPTETMYTKYYMEKKNVTAEKGISIYLTVVPKLESEAAD